MYFHACSLSTERVLHDPLLPPFSPSSTSPHPLPRCLTPWFPRRPRPLLSLNITPFPYSFLPPTCRTVCCRLCALSVCYGSMHPVTSHSPSSRRLYANINHNFCPSLLDAQNSTNPPMAAKRCYVLILRRRRDYLRQSPPIGPVCVRWVLPLSALICLIWIE